MKTLSLARNIGYSVLFLCLSLFVAQFYIDGLNPRFDLPGVFWANYALSIVFFLYYLISLKNAPKEHKRKFRIYIYPIALVIFSISAHTLNYGAGLTVFAPYVNWLTLLMILMHLAVLIHPYREALPKFAKKLLLFSYGVFVLLCLYMIVFILPLMAFSIPGALFYGISTHSFVPLFFLILLLKGIWRVSNETWAKKPVLYGFGLAVLLMGGFLFKWYQVQQKVESAIEKYETHIDNRLPKWALISQNLPEDPLTEYVIVGNFFTQESFWDRGLNSVGSIGELRTHHDPLAFLASTFFGQLDWNRETVQKVLEARYGARHQTHRRLWRGDKLETSRVQTEMEIHSDYRLAYVEKTLDIHFARKGERRWREQQEAVYSFYLPEGSVATSLSLWINGKEEKSRLTTKSKADSAYVSIVGVERRDPALLHWQEGNRVTVTVFPCTPDEDRRFKIGFTMPISYKEGRLHLDNIYFEGPPPIDTKEIVKIRFVGTEPQDLALPYSLKKVNEKEYGLEANYAPHWHMDWEAPALANGSFSFQGKSYEIQELEKELSSWRPEQIILDINSSWKAFELDAMKDLLKEYKVYVFNPTQTELTEDNYEAILSEMRELHFSMLPLQDLPDPAKSLIISSGTPHAPLLADLEGSSYAQNLSNFLLGQMENYRFFNLGSEVSPYIQTLYAFHRLDFVSGNLQELQKLLKEEQFPKVKRDENHIALQNSQVQISQKFLADSLSPENTGPDHLMRLFRYNELLQDIGKQFFDREALEEDWIKKAEEAYVLSPVSSLIVLETLKDYERFGIEENENTLGNAKMGNSGAVPEPHEWALILLVLSLIVWKVRGRFL